MNSWLVGIVFVATVALLSAVGWNRQSEELQAPMMRRAERRAWAALPGARAPRDLPPDGPVIHIDRLFAACAGQYRAGTAAKRLS